MPTYIVRYYDEIKSRSGNGIQQRTFLNEDEAVMFASKNKLYAKPCVVMEVY